ncbi:MAG: tRNA (adenine-N1)-methyltransferase [Methanomassiliicoccales archaeon]
MLSRGDLLYLLDRKGRRFWFVLDEGIIRIEGLGLVDGNRILNAEPGAEIKIMDKEFFLMKPGIPELMESIERTTQIVTGKDAASIIHYLDLKSGDVVIEAGAGSGCLTMALLNVVRPHGRVITYEVRSDFAEKARMNVNRAKLASWWELRIGDIKTAQLECPADAVVLDIPDPWEAVENIAKMLKGSGRFCAYVPNVNQLENTVKKLRAMDFIEIRAFENLQRSMEVHDGGTRPSFEMLGHTGYLIFARKVIRQQAHYRKRSEGVA